MCFCVDLLVGILSKLDDIFKVTKEGISLAERTARFLLMVAILSVLAYIVLKAFGVR